MNKIYFVIAFVVISFGAFLTECYSQSALQIYGGKDHDVYLGCLNCSAYDQSSIWNEYGKFGSSHSASSIWNDYSLYGSEYGAYSPFNSYASNPPVIVNSNGEFFGYFTINEYHNKRADFSLVLTLYKYHNSIREDVSGWYDKIF